MQESNQNRMNILPVDSNKYISKREGECKLGEKLNFISVDGIDKSDVDFIVLGIPEDIGPRANCGKGGAQHAWECFLEKFLNIQDNLYLHGDKVGILGALDCSDLMSQSLEADIHELRTLCLSLDQRVTELIRRIVEAGKIPIVIGGGHNNAYGIIKGTSLAIQDAIAVINCDPHADFRALEGRHSGNGFSYAQSEGYLNEYLVFGAHESYNSEHILKQLSPSFKMITLDDILRKGYSILDALNGSLQLLNNHKIGLEFDMDGIANMPSSAIGPSGLSVNVARQFIMHVAKNKSCYYLHLPEAAPLDNDNSRNIVGKTLAYLVSDFIKTIQKTD